MAATLTHPETHTPGSAWTSRWRAAIARVPLVLVLILAAAAVQSIAWDISLPAFQGPDENGHFAYVQHLAETGTLPSRYGGTQSVSSEESEALRVLNLRALIGNPSARPAWTSADLGLWHQAERNLPPGSRTNGVGPNSTAQNPPLYYAIMAVPYRVFVWLPLLKRVFLLRLFNAAFFLITVALTWIVAGDLFGRVRWKQAVAAGAVAVQPQLAYLSAVINADNLLIALCTAVFVMAVRLVMRGPSLGRVLGTSSLVAAACLTHGRGLATIPVLGVALVVAAVRHRTRRRDALVGAAAAIVPILAGLGLVVLVGNGGTGGGSLGGSLYGGQVHALNTGAFNLRQFLSSIYQFYFPKLPSMRPRIGPEYGYRQVFINTFYGTFGSLEVTWRQRIYDLLQVGSALGLVAFYTACVARWRSLVRSWPVVTVMLAFLFVTLFFLHYASYRALIGNGGIDPIIVGRYLLPMVALFGLAIAFTVGSLPRRIGPPVGAAILSIGVLLALGGIGITAVRFYG